MKDRKNLTKSLHTVSAVVAVALHLRGLKGKSGPIKAQDAAKLVGDSLVLLGQGAAWAGNDETVMACIAKLIKVCGQG